MDESELFCSNCKRYVGASNFASHSAFCERNIKICTLCDEPVPISEEKEHFESSHITISCDLCSVVLEKWMLPQHQEACPKRLVTCEFCEAEVPFDDYAAHIDFCGSRTEKCLLCQKYVMLKNKTEHSEFHLHEVKSKKECARKEVYENISNESKACNIEKDKKKFSSPENKNLTIDEQKSNFEDLSRIDSLMGATACVPDKSKSDSKHYTVCHLCHQSIRWVDFNTHIPTCASNSGKCSRCGQSVPTEELKDHVLVTCPFIGKKELPRNKSELKILEDECSGFQNKFVREPQIMKSCPYCKRRFSTDEILGHIALCPENCFVCDLCSEKIHERDRNKHNSQCRMLYPADSFECSLCSERVLEEDRFKHSSSQCKALHSQISSKLCECPLCGERLLEGDMEAHMSLACPALMDTSPGNLSLPVAESESKVAEDVNYSFLDSFSEAYQMMETCPFCKKEFSADQISRHAMSCTDDTFICELCSVKVPEKDKSTHRSQCRKLHPEDSFVCAMCFENVPEKDRKMHSISKCKALKSRTSSELHSCPLCEEELSEEDIAIHQSFACKALLETNSGTLNSHALHLQSSSTTLKNSSVGKLNHSKTSVETCINCHNKVAKEHMSNHLRHCLSCKKTEKCFYCQEEIDCTSEELHLEQCKGLNHSRVTSNAKKDYEVKGAVPKYSSFAHKEKPQVGKCKYCKTTLNANILLYHESECVQQPIKCTECSATVVLSEWDSHEIKCKSSKKKGKRGRGKQQKSETSEHGGWFSYLTGRNKTAKSHDEYENQKNLSLETQMKDTFVPEADANLVYPYFSQPFMHDVKIPCEFCGEQISAADFVLHETGCNPRESSYAKQVSSETAEENETQSVKQNLQHHNSVIPKNSFFADEKRIQSTAKHERLREKQVAEGQPGEFLKAYNKKLSQLQTDNSKNQCERENCEKSAAKYLWNMDSNTKTDETEIHSRHSAGKMPYSMRENMKNVTEECVNSDDSDEELSSMLAFIKDKSETVTCSQSEKSMTVPLECNLKFEKHAHEEINQSKEAAEANQLEDVPYKEAYEYILKTDVDNCARDNTMQLASNVNLMNNKIGTSAVVKDNLYLEKHESRFHEDLRDARLSEKNAPRRMPDFVSEDHVSKDCIMCPICLSLVQRNLYKDHLVDCAFKSEMCSLCFKKVATLELKDHLLNECPKFFMKSRKSSNSRKYTEPRVNPHDKDVTSLGGTSFVSDLEGKSNKSFSYVLNSGVCKKVMACNSEERRDCTKPKNRDFAPQKKSAFAIEPAVDYQYPHGINDKKEYDSCKAGISEPMTNQKNVERSGEFCDDVEKWAKWRSKKDT